MFPAPDTQKPRRKRGFCVSGAGNIHEFPCITGAKLAKFGWGGLASPLLFRGGAVRLGSLLPSRSGVGRVPERPRCLKPIGPTPTPPLKRRGFRGTLFTSLPSPIIGLRHVFRTRPNRATYPPLGVSWRALLWRAAALRGRLTARQSDKPSFRKLPS